MRRDLVGTRTGKMTNKTAQIVVRLEPEVKEALLAFSEKVGISASALITIKIKEMLKTGKLEVAASSNLDEQIQNLIGPAF